MSSRDVSDAHEYHPSSNPTAPPLPAKLRALFAAFLVVALLAMVLGVTAVAYLALEASQQSERNGELLKQVKGTNNRLSDCTTPGGKCYEDAQKRTGKAIVGINEGTMRVIIAALSCQADGVTEQRELLACTAERATAEPPNDR